MRKMVQQLQARVAGFVSEREDLVLLVRCTEADCALVTKILEGLDESSASELYWVVVDDFESAPAFVDACVRAFSTKYEAVRLTLEKQNLPPWPPLPPSVADPASLPPVERLKALITFSRSLLPTLTGCGVVWAFLPMQIKDDPAYAEFVSSLWKHRFPFPWCHHVRMVIRDQFDAAVLEQRAAGSPRIATYTADFSPDAIRRSLEEEAGEDQTPLANRVNACLMLAGIDYSHGRYDRAIQQYEVVHKYAAATQNPTLAAIALNGLGDVLQSKGLVDESGHMLQAAIAPAALAPQPPVPVLMNIYSKLGEVRHSQRRWAEAEVFLKGAADFALLLRDPSQRLRSWKLLGEAQYRQDKTTEALKTWFAGAVVAGKLAMDGDYDTFVKYLRNHYEQTGNQQDLARVMARVGHEIAKHKASADPNTTASA